MKLATIGSYGHVGDVLGSSAMQDLELVAAARWGHDDPLAFIGEYPCAPKTLDVYDDYRKMLDEVKPDIVAVLMPLYRNAEASIAAAQRGCHIVSEKPLATTLDDLAALHQAVTENNVSLAALFTMRGEPVFQAAKHAVQSGRIGQPILASGQKSYPFAQRDDFYKDRATYGGSIPWQAIHAIDFVSYCTGKDYTRVAAMASNAAHPSHPGMEDNGGLLLELAGGGHAVIRFDYLRPHGKVERPWGDDRLRIAGTEGIVEVVHQASEVILKTPDADEKLKLPEPRDLFAEFVNSLNGDGDGLVTTAESFRITEVALKARHAADTGTVIEL